MVVAFTVRSTTKTDLTVAKAELIVASNGGATLKPIWKFITNKYQFYPLSFIVCVLTSAEFDCLHFGPPKILILTPLLVERERQPYITDKNLEFLEKIQTFFTFFSMKLIINMIYDVCNMNKDVLNVFWDEAYNEII